MRLHESQSVLEIHLKDVLPSQITHRRQINHLGGAKRFFEARQSRCHKRPFCFSSMMMFIKSFGGDQFSKPCSVATSKRPSDLPFALRMRSEDRRVGKERRAR